MPSSSVQRRQQISRAPWELLARPCITRAFEGNAAKSLQEAAALDELIDVMLSAKSQQEVAGLVAQNIMAIDTKFWMRVATRNDSATSQADKDRLRALADTVMVLVDTMVKQSEQKLSDSAATLQAILAAAADENGEWYLPLAPQQVKAIRDAMDRSAEALDEALLSNAFAYIKKASDDRFDSLVQLLQKILQLYAARSLRGPEKEGVEGFLNDLVYAEEKDWEPLLRERVAKGEVGEEGFMEALQRKMEATVLGLQSGSYAQRVQAEYLKEVEARAKAVFRESA
ncbi:hypothetical protein MNEG_12333 [Monoraphidium neglectum]|uniref:Uncharacterized protein n=1 Tax=Monoraphidium neglectum TaxID=145388 RepID=A0A0D2LVV7_9CHLO|nr:hypothetical protein MNEG_12333 [Monoraphidium neglectum]KIY95629.1 hypothetical protein MNEG_12333 [Monoraphidium neglectum]|eukprot:XP_013894649.1 hypothetical protein MNEG_12333 [Monoraphidium neglectum]